eukprot:g48119.t1
MAHFSDKVRLDKLGLFSLEQRRLRVGTIEVYAAGPADLFQQFLFLFVERICCIPDNPGNPQGDIVSDIQLLPDKNPLPSGYAFISEFLDPKVTVSKKKRLCIKTVPFGGADTAVFDVKLTGKSKQIVPLYTCIGELSGFVIWCRKGRLAKPKPLPKPRSIALDMRGLSLENESSRKREELDVAPARLSKRRTTLEHKDSVYSAENIYGISAMDGVPFVLHPRFESTSVNVPSANIANFQIKSHAEIENE